MVDYASLFSDNLPRSVATPPGASDTVKYIFSITNAVPEVVDGDEYLAAIRTGLEANGAASLAGYPPPGGHVGLREMIAERLAANRGYKVSPGDVFISDGAGGAIAIILESFINQGDAVLVEEFTYMGSLRMMMERGAEPIHVACDDDGILPDALEDTLASLENSGRRAKFVWTIPVYQNPLGFTVSEGRRRAILEVAQKYGVPVMENESYADFRIDGDPLPPAMSGISDQGDVFYVSSFTKLLGCGLRVGFGVLPPGVQDALPRVNAENLPRRSVSHLATTLVYEYMRAHEADHIEAVRQALLARRDAMIEAPGEQLPILLRVDPPPRRNDDVRQAARQRRHLVHPGQGPPARDVKYNPGGMFRSDRGRNNHLRLTYSHNSPEEIREGVARLAELFQEEGYFEG